MCKRAKRWAVAVALAVACLVGLAGRVRAAEDGQQTLLDKFHQGITAYETGEYDQARQAFSEVLAMKPGMQAALQMRSSAELQEFVKMRDIPQLKDQAEQILKLMMRAGREARRNIENVDQLLADFRSPEATTYGKAAIDLKGHGPYAVPYVVGMLALDKADERVVVGNAAALLAGLHPDAVLPLCQVLTGTDNSLVRQRVAGVLGQLKDERAVPSLMQVWADPNTLDSTRAAAAEALKAITGKEAAALPSAADEYLDLGRAYLFEDAARVGYTYGLSADVWTWNSAGEDWPGKVTYEEVPAYLYYQRMATDTALAGLAAAPGDADLQSLLAAGLVRQLALCEYNKTAAMPAGEEDMADKVHADAEKRAARLEVDVPIALSLMETPQVSGGLSLTVQAADGPASLYLDKAVARKMKASGGQLPGATTVDALLAALKSGDKDVRYNAAVDLVQACPTGECGSPKEIMDVLSGAVGAAAGRTALIIMRDYGTLNSLVSVVRGAGVATMDVRPEEHLIDYMLSLQPSVDIVFLGGNVSDGVMARMIQFLQNDVRTKAAPIYVIVDPTQPAADLTKYSIVQQVLTPDHIRSTVLDPILKEKVLAKSRSAFTDEEEALVLKAVKALNGVDPRTTKYPFAVLEPGLIEAASGYSDEVTGAVVDALHTFGSAACLPALAGIVSGDKGVDLKVAACDAIAAVLKRTGTPASEDLMAALKGTLDSDDQSLRQAGAEALSVAGLSPQDRLSLIQSAALAK